jgi:hypothetical protein
MMSPRPSTLDGESRMSGNREVAAWRQNAERLAEWAWDRLVNRRDVWGGYYRAVGGATQQTTHPRKADRGRAKLRIADLARHFAARQTRDVIGTHSTSPDNTSLWGGIDIDWHGQTSPPPAVNLAAALHWYVRLGDLGIRPLLTDSNGAGSFHLLAVFAAPVATAKVFHFLRWLTQDYQAVALSARPETFPKQARIDPARCGNWLRVFGRHHTRQHWSRVWDGAQWLAGEPAVAFILALKGDDPGLIPAVALAAPPGPDRATAPPKRSVQMPAGHFEQRIRAYLEKLPAGLGEGQHRDDYGFTFAAFLVRDLNLSDAEALPWMEIWDGRNAAPKGTARLQELLKNARTYGRNAYGAGLNRPGRTPIAAGKRRHPLRHIRFKVEV